MSYVSQVCSTEAELISCGGLTALNLLINYKHAFVELQNKLINKWVNKTSILRSNY